MFNGSPKRKVVSSSLAGGAKSLAAGPFSGGCSVKETLNNSSAAGQQIFFPIRAVQKTGNPYRIPPFSEPSAGE